MSICVAFIPYRSDDLTRANPDLSGRVESISLDYWEPNDLEKIGERGFRELKRFPNELVLKSLARESIGSPHLMQKLCLEMCNELNIFERADETVPMEVGSEEIKRVLRRTGDKEDFTTIFEIISGGAAKRGAERNSFYFRKGRHPIKGDVYDAILRAIAANPPKLTIDQNEIFDRINEICVDESPRSGNVTQAIQRMDEWISDFSDDVHVFDWVEERKSLEIPDPYLIFYLRWSNKVDFEPDLH